MKNKLSKLNADQYAEIYTDEARERYLTKIPQRLSKEFDILKEKIRKGTLSESKCVIYSGLDKAVYFKTKSLAERALKFYQAADLDYRDSEFFHIINEFKVINKMLIERDEKMDLDILKHGDDVEDKEGKITKRGDWKAIARVQDKMNDVNTTSEDATQEIVRPTVNIQINGDVNLDELVLQSSQKLYNKHLGDLEI